MAATWCRGSCSKDIKDHGASAIATMVVAPVAAKLLKRVARKPISDMNRLLKTTGVSTSVGVKI